MLRFISLLYISLSCLSAYCADFRVPHALDQQDRITFLETLGTGLVPKFLGNPFPLGGYMGLEVGMTYETVDLDDLRSIGDKPSNPSSLSVSRLSLGKGLYSNIDLYVQFTPQPMNDNVMDFGGMMRWGFYESAFLPASFSLIVQSNTANFDNLVTTNSVGFLLLAGIYMNEITFYLGGGQTRILGRFSSKVNEGTPSVSESDEIVRFQTLIGMTFTYSDVFLALEVDRFTQSSYSAKLGFTF